MLVVCSCCLSVRLLVCVFGLVGLGSLSLVFCSASVSEKGFLQTVSLKKRVSRRLGLNVLGLGLFLLLRCCPCESIGCG